MYIGIDIGLSSICASLWDPFKLRIKTLKRGQTKDRVISSSNIFGTLNTNDKAEIFNKLVFIFKSIKHESEVYLTNKLKKSRDETSIKESQLIIKGMVVACRQGRVIEMDQTFIRDAAYEAGFNDIVFMDETEAALCAYGLQVYGNKRLLTIDMGCSSTRLSLWDISQSRIPEKKCAIYAYDELERNISGREMDKQLLEYIVNSLDKDGKLILGVSSILVSNDILSWEREELMRACEQCKIDLSSSENSEVLISKKLSDRIINPIKNSNYISKYLYSSSPRADSLVSIYNLSRNQLNIIYKQVYESFEDSLNRFLMKYSVATTSDQPNCLGSLVQEVVIFGGVSESDLIKNSILSCLKSRKPQSDVDTQNMDVKCPFDSLSDLCFGIKSRETVARGLAVKGAMIGGVENHDIMNCLMEDVVRRDIGVIIDDQAFIRIINEGTRLPAKTSFILPINVSDNNGGKQVPTAVELPVYEAITDPDILSQITEQTEDVVQIRDQYYFKLSTFKIDIPKYVSARLSTHSSFDLHLMFNRLQGSELIVDLDEDWYRDNLNITEILNNERKNDKERGWWIHIHVTEELCAWVMLVISVTAFVLTKIYFPSAANA